MQDKSETLERAASLSEAPAPVAVDDETLGTTVDHVIDTVTIGQQQALESVETASAAIVQSLAGVRRELAGFVTTRIREDLDAQCDLMRCRTFAEMQALQSRYVRTAVDQYAAEASRLVRLGSETMTKSLGRG